MAARSKWTRLSLRSALLITTVTCLWFGWQAYTHKQQAEALSNIRELGGQFRTNSAKPQFLQSLFHQEQSTQARDVTDVFFLGAEFSDADIDAFARCAAILPRLERIMMTDTMVTRNGHQSLREKLPDLEIKVINLIDSGGSAFGRF